MVLGKDNPPSDDASKNPDVLEFPDIDGCLETSLPGLAGNRDPDGSRTSAETRAACAVESVSTRPAANNNGEAAGSKSLTVGGRASESLVEELTIWPLSAI